MTFKDQAVSVLHSDDLLKNKAAMHGIKKLEEMGQEITARYVLSLLFFP